MASLLCLCCFWSLFSVPAQSHNRQRTSLYWSERTELLVPPFAALFIFDGFFAPLPLHGELRYRSRSCANPLFSQSAFDLHIQSSLWSLLTCEALRWSTQVVFAKYFNLHSQTLYRDPHWWSKLKNMNPSCLRSRDCCMVANISIYYGMN